MSPNPKPHKQTSPRTVVFFLQENITQYIITYLESQASAEKNCMGGSKDEAKGNGTKVIEGDDPPPAVAPEQKEAVGVDAEPGMEKV